jgi:hypothetical protein
MQTYLADPGQADPNPNLRVKANRGENPNPSLGVVVCHYLQLS